MGVILTIIDLVLAAGVIIGGAIGVVILGFFGIFVKTLPFLIKLSAIAVVVYAFLKMFGTL